MQFSLAEKGPLYALASRLIVAEVDDALWSSLALAPLPSLLGKLDPALSEMLGHALTEQQEEALAVEFARLFVLPGGTAPYASQWLAAKDDQAASREEIISLATQVMTILEIEPSSVGPGGRLPIEHVGLLFEIAAHAAQSADPSVRSILAPLETQLFGPAWQSFGQAIEQFAEQPVYRALGRLISAMHT